MTIRKEEQKVKKKWSIAKFGSCSTVPSPCILQALFLQPPCSPAFHALLFLLQFLVFLLYTLVLITYVWIVWYFTWFVRLHKPFVYTVGADVFFFAVNKIRALFSIFPVFLSFSIPFLFAKHPPRMTTWRMSG